MILRGTSQRRLPRAGFTLMEMMVVVAIIVALAGIGIIFLWPQAEQGNIAKAKADIANLNTVVGIYKAQHGGAPPATLDVLLNKDDQGFGPYLKNAEALLSPFSVGGQPIPYGYDASGQTSGGANRGEPDIWVDSPAGRICNWTKQLIRTQ